MNLIVYSKPWAQVRNGPGVYDFAKGVDPEKKVWIVEQRGGNTSRFFVFPMKVKENDVGRTLSAGWQSIPFGGRFYAKITDVDTVLEWYRAFTDPIRYDVVNSIVRYRLTPGNTVIFVDFQERAVLLPVAKEVE